MKKNTYQSLGLNLLMLCFLAFATLSCGSKKKIIDYDPSADLDSGYGTSKAYNNTGSSNGTETNQGAHENLSLLDLLRRASGVTVQGKEENARIKVRGAASFVANSEPLFVVDGVPMGNTFNSVANFVNPNDVKRIRVLSGPDATLYGARGANGVIVITMNK